MEKKPRKQILFPYNLFFSSVAEFFYSVATFNPLREQAASSALLSSPILAPSLPPTFSLSLFFFLSLLYSDFSTDHVKHNFTSEKLPKQCSESAENETPQIICFYSRVDQILRGNSKFWSESFTFK